MSGRGAAGRGGGRGAHLSPVQRQRLEGVHGDEDVPDVGLWAQDSRSAERPPPPPPAPAPALT